MFAYSRSAYSYLCSFGTWATRLKWTDYILRIEIHYSRCHFLLYIACSSSRFSKFLFVTFHQSNSIHRNIFRKSLNMKPIVLGYKENWRCKSWFNDETAFFKCFSNVNLIKFCSKRRFFGVFFYHFFSPTYLNIVKLHVYESRFIFLHLFDIHRSVYPKFCSINQRLQTCVSWLGVLGLWVTRRRGKKFR